MTIAAFSKQLLMVAEGELEIVWVDDLFWDDRLNVPADSERSETQSVLDAKALGVYMNDLRGNVSLLESAMRLKEPVRRLHYLFEACKEVGAGLKCGNFEWAESQFGDGVGVPMGYAVLLDVQHSYVRGGNSHGIRFSERKGFRKNADRWKFWTRKAFEIASEVDPSQILGPQAGDVLQWLKSLVFRVHGDRGINRAIEYFSRPWRERWERPQSGYWHHNAIEESGQSYRRLIGEWLGPQAPAPENEAVKGLGMLSTPELPWNLLDPSHCGPDVSSRRIQSDVLSFALSSLGICLSNKLPNGEMWCLPVSPGLPFLTAFRQFLLAASAEGRSPCVCMRRLDGVLGQKHYVLSVEFPKVHKKQAADPFGLAIKHAKERITGRFSGVSEAYENLIHCRTGGILPDQLNDEENAKWLSIFGVGVEFPCVGTVFGKFMLTLHWTGQRKLDLSRSESEG